MKERTFCIVSPIRDGGALAQFILEAEKRLAANNINFTRPKIGKHITFIPPFFAAEHEMCWIAVGLEVAKAFYSDTGTPVMVKGKEIDFYRGEGADALVLKLETSPVIRDLVKHIRSIVPKYTQWKYPPESYLENFHATIAEGQGLASVVESHGVKEGAKGGLLLFDGMRSDIHARLEPPTLVEKTSTGWQQWRVVNS